MPKLNPTTMDGTEAVQMLDLDDDLSIYKFILKYQLQFTNYFGPRYAFGVTDASWSQTGSADRIVATARVQPAYQSTKGRTCQFDVPYDKFKVWRKNVNLYDFIS